MITYWYFHPNAAKYFFKRKSDILTQNLSKLREYSGHDFRLIVEFDYVTLVDYTDNRFVFRFPITRDMHDICINLAQLRDYWYYTQNSHRITNEELYNTIVKLSKKFKYE